MQLAWYRSIVATVLQIGRRSNKDMLCRQVRILEAFMDFSPPSATVFREIGGLSSMIDRLKLEVHAAPVAASPGAEGGAEAMQTDVAASSSAVAASSPAGKHLCLQAGLRLEF